MAENQEIKYCPSRGVNLTAHDFYRCTQGLCSAKTSDCSLIITYAQTPPKCTEPEKQEHWLEAVDRRNRSQFLDSSVADPNFGISALPDADW